MRKKLKQALLRSLKRAGAFERAANSEWRRGRLLILCYHGIALEDEHRWRPALYIETELLAGRLKALREMQCSVLPLSEGLTHLASGDLPPRAVAITFDDGTYDFYKQAYPLLKQYGLPVTVYQTTYYTEHELPVFNLTCSYLLWKRRAGPEVDLREFGLSASTALRTEVDRHRIVRGLIELSERENLTGVQKNELVRRLASVVGFDFEEFTAKRMLRLMNAKELAEIATGGVDVQLHTHRHRSPDDEASFRREIKDNRERIRILTGLDAKHFCYPSGVYRKELSDWLEKERVVSATTCDVGLASRDDDPYLLPRIVDTTGRSAIEFESWLCGVGQMLTLRRAASRKYVLPRD